MEGPVSREGSRFILLIPEGDETALSDEAAATTNQADMRGLPVKAEPHDRGSSGAASVWKRESSLARAGASHSSGEGSPIVPASPCHRPPSGNSYRDGCLRPPGVPARLGHCRPHETSQLASHCRDCDCGAVAVADELTVPTVQAVLGAPCLRDDGWRLVRGMTREPVAKARTMSIVPSRLDEEA